MVSYWINHDDQWIQYVLNSGNMWQLHSTSLTLSSFVMSDDQHSSWSATCCCMNILFSWADTQHLHGGPTCGYRPKHSTASIHIPQTCEGLRSLNYPTLTTFDKYKHVYSHKVRHKNHLTIPIHVSPCIAAGAPAPLEARAGWPGLWLQWWTRMYHGALMAKGGQCAW